MPLLSLEVQRLARKLGIKSYAPDTKIDHDAIIMWVEQVL